MAGSTESVEADRALNVTVCLKKSERVSMSDCRPRPESGILGKLNRPGVSRRKGEATFCNSLWLST
jgi:hypothetical protein